VRQAVSVGDVFTYAGVAWLIVAGMRGRRREPDVVTGAWQLVDDVPPTSEEASTGAV
jgi:hypothetical protein